MRYALNPEKEKIEVSYSGEIAKCDICNSKVKGRKGEQRIEHWYHHEKATIDCDNWYEPMSEWHRRWQDLFPLENREVSITENSKTHRADILLNNGLVIEIQNSSITFSDIVKREAFYGKNNMIWILNGQTLVNKSLLVKEVFKYNYMLSISIPKDFPSINNYDFNLLLNNILEIGAIDSLKSNEKNIFEIKNENILTFHLINDVELDFNLIKPQFSYFIVGVFTELYNKEQGEVFRKLIRIEYEEKNKTITQLRLIKKYWKKFIDKMDFPVFIDNLNGIHKNELYYYSENRIIDKNKFINHYLKYT